NANHPPRRKVLAPLGIEVGAARDAIAAGHDDLPYHRQRAHLAAPGPFRVRDERLLRRAARADRAAVRRANAAVLACRAPVVRARIDGARGGKGMPAAA